MPRSVADADCRLVARLTDHIQIRRDDANSNAISMALGIRTAHLYTVKDLANAQCRQTCDEICAPLTGAPKTCDRLAPYIDLSTLQRYCLDVGGPCRGREHRFSPMDAEQLGRSSPLPGAGAQHPAPSFYAIPAEYWIREGHYGRRRVGRTPFFNTGSIPSEDWLLHLYRRKLSVAYAPWLSPGSCDVTEGFLCPLCMAAIRGERRPQNGVFPRAMTDIVPNVCSAPFLVSEEQWNKHMECHHPFMA